MAEGLARPDVETQKKEITSLLKSPLNKGDTWYLLDQKWFKVWKNHVGYDKASSGYLDDTGPPGPIDNSSLFPDEQSLEIRDGLMEEMEFVLVPESAWHLLVAWYSLEEGRDQAIPRTVVEYGMFVKQYKVEVYLLEFFLCENNEPEKQMIKKFSKVDTVEHIENEMKVIFGIPESKETRLWNKYSSNTYEYLSDKTKTLQDAGLYHGQVLIIEQQNDDQSWPRQTRSTNSYSNSSLSTTGAAVPSNMATRSYGSSSGGGVVTGGYDYDHHNGGSCPAQGGLCGLSNLGNTCFMNAALQCMSNTPPLTEYFLDNKYVAEINSDNPLGMRGEMAKYYGDLIKTMWSGRCAYTVPRDFKLAVGRFAPQFSGYQQQDCQELMAFLLDGLHEDLNRVKKKPYIQVKDSDGRSDALLAEEAWNNYRQRNNSIIVDTFHGLLKSTVICPQCAKVSVTFDPFCYLSLPLPQKRLSQVELTMVPRDPRQRSIRLKVMVNKTGSILDLCTAISETLTQLTLDPERLIVAEVNNNKFRKIFQASDCLDAILEKETSLLVFEVLIRQDDSTVLHIPVIMREKKRPPNAGGKFVFSMNPFIGQPMLLEVVKKNLPTYEALYALLIKQMGRFVSQPPKDNLWWEEESEELKTDDDDDPMATGEDSEGVSRDLSNGTSAPRLQTEQEKPQRNEEECLELQCPPRLFCIHTVNTYGNCDAEIFDDGKPLRLSAKSQLALEWHPKGKDQFYDEIEAKELEVHESVNTKVSQKKQCLKLSECLKLFTTTEKLGAEDLWYCPSCKKHQQATKKFDVWSLPKCLIIHLKRFSYNRYWRDKIDVLVDFPVNDLNMSKYLIDPRCQPDLEGKRTATYDLIAVANHYGGMGGGHYTAFAKNKGTESWYYFDDTAVSAASADSVVSKAAYVLFYTCRQSGSVTPSLTNRNISAALGAPPTTRSAVGRRNTSNDKDNLGSSDEDMDCI